MVAEELTSKVIQLEGGDLVPVELGHTDTNHTTCLHAPSIGLVVAGDAVYNDIHLYLAESSPQSRREWIAALDTIDALNPRAVVAGHKKPERNDNPGNIEESDTFAISTTSLRRPPLRGNFTRECWSLIPIGPIRVRSSAQAAKG